MVEIDFEKSSNRDFEVMPRMQNVLGDDTELEMCALSFNF